MGTEKEKIEVKVDSNAKELTILTGEAPRPFNIQRQRIEGIITAPLNFARIRGVDVKKDHVRVDRNARTIIYVYNERMNEGGDVWGYLTIHPDLAFLEINEKEEQTLRSLADKLKFSRRYFTDIDQHAKTITALNNYKATISTDVEQSSDMRGNSKNLRDKKVESNVPVEFTLNIPLYVGFPPKKFRVEVYFDTTEGGTRVWLESIEMAELMIKEREGIMDAEVNQLREMGLVIIEQ